MDGAAITTDVDDSNAPVDQDSTHEQPSVAMYRIFFTAEHRHPIPICPCKQALKPRIETFGLGHRAVENMTVTVVEIWLWRATAEFRTQEDVLDVGIEQGCTETVPIKLRVELGKRLRTNVRDNLDLVPAQHAQQGRQLMRRVPKSPNCHLTHPQEFTPESLI